MFNENKKFDYIIPIGCHCLPASILRDFAIREASFPFDWLYINNDIFFEPAMNCILDNFQNFLIKENITILDIPVNPLHIPCCDTKTGFIFIHDFVSGITPLSDFNAIKEKYAKRIKRLLKVLSGKSDILFLYFDECGLDDDIFISKMEELSKKFNKSHLNLLILQHAPSFGEFDTEEKYLADNIIKINFNNDQKFAPSENQLWKRNYKVSSKIVKKYCKLKFNLLKFIFSVRKTRIHSIYKIFGFKIKVKNK